ncbi:hypothetical protein ACFW0H_03035 [Pseudomonas sp. CR3202]|uniref:hypothetical protein n=1 Tax=Pseudomonas sp. CR3202 TaxID=3351532 RepID=UPI003BF3986C
MAPIFGQIFIAVFMFFSFFTFFKNMEESVNIQQAIVKSRIQFSIGVLLMLGGMLFYIIATLLFVHRQAQVLAQSQIFGHLGISLQNLVADIYQLTSPYLDFIWSHAPTLSQEDPFSFGNLLGMGLLGIMTVGGQIIGASSRLRDRVKRHLERIEEYEWKRSLQNSGGTVVNARDVGVINVYKEAMPPSNDKEWWERPLGIIGLAIIGGYIVGVLLKITGML